MPRRGKQDYLDDAYESDHDYDDDYDVKQHPTSKYAKGLRTGAKQREEANEDVIEGIDVDPNYHRHLIGRQGVVRLEIETKFNVVVDIPKKDSHEKKVYVSGRRADCIKALDEIKAIVAKEKAKSAVSAENTAFPSLPGQEIVTVSVDFEKSAIGLFIGQGGSRIRDLKHKLMSRGDNLPIANKEVGVEVILPDRSDTSSIITIKIPKHAEDRADKIIREFCSFYELLPHLKSIVVGHQSVGSVLKGDDGKGRGAEKASKTKNNNNNNSKPPSAAAALTTTSNNNTNNKTKTNQDQSNNATSSSSSSNNNQNNNELNNIVETSTTTTRPERKFPDFVDDKTHQVLECRF